MNSIIEYNFVQILCSTGNLVESLKYTYIPSFMNKTNVLDISNIYISIFYVNTM